MSLFFLALDYPFTPQCAPAHCWQYYSNFLDLVRKVTINQHIAVCNLKQTGEFQFDINVLYQGKLNIILSVLVKQLVTEFISC